MVALITGATGAIGESIARRLYDEGNEIVLHYNSNIIKAQQLSRELGNCKIVGCDLSTNLDNFADTNVDILVLNAGISLQGLMCDTTPSQLNHIMQVNLTSAYELAQMMLPHMINQKYGRIITISSMWGEVGASCEVAYSASKAGLIGFTKALAKEVAPSGITVNCVSPGFIQSEMNSNLEQATISQLIEETPVGRIGIGDDVANAVSFFANNNSGFITGQILGVNGGMIT